MKIAVYLTVFLLWAIAGCRQPGTAVSEEGRLTKKPNIIYILADDLGYGDLSSYHAESRIRTPHLDKLASEGMRFTDAHSPSSVCTPTRYALLTGRYAWRSRLPVGVLRGYGRALLDNGRPTVAGMLQAHGYRTGVVGKWHLGLDWALKPGHEHALEAPDTRISSLGIVTDMNPEHIDFTRPPENGPLDHGFDYSFILPASLDMEPYCYLENDSLLEIPDGHTEGSDLNTGYTGAFYRPGKIAPGFRFDEVLPSFVDRAIKFVEEAAQAPEPFFLYLPLAAPHTPWVPKKSYDGTSGAGQYGDFVQMVDAEVGRFLEACGKLGLDENTIVMFASDNGPFWRPEHATRFGHRAAHHFRGMKADAWEGGHRVPFIVRWPGTVEAGAVYNGVTTLTDLYATCADLLDIPLAEHAPEDSHSILPALLGANASDASQRAVVHHSGQGLFAIRKGEWKYIEGLGSGGFSPPQSVAPEPGQPPAQLYHLGRDPGEVENVYAAYPEKVRELEEDLRNVRGR